MIDQDKLEQGLSELPLYAYHHITADDLEFADRIRWICEHECPMYGKTWACPPGVGTVEHCAGKCRSFDNCLMIATITEVEDIADIQQTLATRPEHEEVTNQVGAFLEEQGVKPYILSTEACAECERCAYLDGQPCRFPDRMHPCVESHGINVIPAMESLGVPFISGENVVTWVSLLFFSE